MDETHNIQLRSKPVTFLTAYRSLLRITAVDRYGGSLSRLMQVDDVGSRSGARSSSIWPASAQGNIAAKVSRSHAVQGSRASSMPGRPHPFKPDQSIERSVAVVRKRHLHAERGFQILEAEQRRPAAGRDKAQERLLLLRREEPSACAKSESLLRYGNNE